MLSKDSAINGVCSVLVASGLVRLAINTQAHS